MTHPLAWPGNKSGAFDMRAGDRVRYRHDGRTGVLDEALPDGDAYVTWDDGRWDTVKWRHLELEKDYLERSNSHGS